MSDTMIVDGMVRTARDLRRKGYAEAAKVLDDQAAAERKRIADAQIGDLAELKRIFNGAEAKSAHYGPVMPASAIFRKWFRAVVDTAREGTASVAVPLKDGDWVKITGPLVWDAGQKKEGLLSGMVGRLIDADPDYDGDLEIDFGFRTTYLHKGSVTRVEVPRELRVGDAVKITGEPVQTSDGGEVYKFRKGHTGQVIACSFSGDDVRIKNDRVNDYPQYISKAVVTLDEFRQYGSPRDAEGVALLVDRTGDFWKKTGSYFGACWSHDNKGDGRFKDGCDVVAVRGPFYEVIQ